MPRQVRIVGDPETYDVLCETDTTKILVNPAARMRQQVVELESRLGEIRSRLALTRQDERKADVHGNQIDGP